jgi:hypothetical protein
MIKLFEHCPACGGPFTITECQCPNCKLLMRGEFQPDPFSVLTQDQVTFIRVFLRARGNLSEVEKILGVSYPTIRNKLDEINLAFDHTGSPAPTAQGTNQGLSETENNNSIEDTRKAVLQQVSSGVLSAAEALQKLRELQGGK